MRPLLLAACVAFAPNAGCASVAGSPAFALHGDDYERARGEYALADGHAVHIVGTRQHPRIEFDDGSTRALAALSTTEFTTLDGCTRVVFEPGANGAVTRLSVTRPRACEGR